ncbi:MAG: Uma2 family endonuclease [Gemmataceae bacterium]|nr:Uma2 family endonuclease [Gemmataceae bacterium]
MASAQRKPDRPTKGNARRKVPVPDAEAIRIPVSAMDIDGFCDWARSRAFPDCARLSFIETSIWITDWLDFPAVVVPVSACTLEGFSAWATSEDFPRQGRISFLGKEIVIDMSPERFQAHGKVRAEIARVIMTLNIEEDLGEFLPDRTLLTNAEVDLSTEPDGAFVLWASLDSGRATLVPCRVDEQDYVEVRGAPDWVLEVISDSTVHDDMVDMRRRYHRAGISEYWLIDARGEEIVFQILSHRPTDYVAVARRGGWQKSRVFGRSFRLVRQRGRRDMWRYLLEIKPG